MVIGGSLGAASVNENIRRILPNLLKEFQVIHLCGKGKMDESLNGTEGYVQYEYIKQELADMFALADVVISVQAPTRSVRSMPLRNQIFLFPCQQMPAVETRS